MPRPPFQIEDFVGQKQALAPVLRQLHGAIARNEPLPPLLLIGQSGLGKSLAARMLAKHASSEFVTFSGTETLKEIVEQLCQRKPGDMVFFDECHKLPSDIQEALYGLIDSGVVPAKFVQGGDGQEPVKIAPISLVFATDQPGELLNALQKRIPTTVQFRPYPESEMKEIVSRVATRRNVLLSPQAARQVAKVCNGLPRRAEQHVQAIRLYFEDSERCQLTKKRVHEYLKSFGIDADGLGPAERAYLRFVARNGSASLEALAGYLGVDVNYVRQQVEQPLRYRRLIMVRSKGRVLTAKGENWIKNDRLARKRGKEKQGG